LGPEFRVKTFDYCYGGDLKQQGGIHVMFPCCFLKEQLLNHFITPCIQIKTITTKWHWTFKFITQI
jgi:hypothetical protein